MCRNNSCPNSESSKSIIVDTICLSSVSSYSYCCKNNIHCDGIRILYVCILSHCYHRCRFNSWISTPLIFVCCENHETETEPTEYGDVGEEQSGLEERRGQSPIQYFSQVGAYDCCATLNSLYRDVLLMHEMYK